MGFLKAGENLSSGRPPERGSFSRKACAIFAAALLSASFYGCSREAEKAAPAGTPAPEPRTNHTAVKKISWDPAAGKIIYEKYCHFCHGRSGRGDGPVGIAISPHPANFVEDTKRMSKSDEELFKSITEGIHRQIGGEEMAMPRWAEILTEKERWDVLAYVRQLSEEGRKGGAKK